jgi:transglutaminase-like putative cysteine protease
MTRSVKVTGIAALATALAATTLSTLVDGVLWFVEVLLLIGVVAVAGALAGRLLRHPLLVVLAQLTAAGVVLAWLYAQPETVYGVLPGPDAVQRLVALTSDGARVTREYGPPAPALPGLRLLVTGGLALVAVVVDLAAVGLRRPAVAGLPLLAVYCVPVALASDGLDWYWFALAATGFLVLVASDSGERVARWGRVLSGEGGRTAPMAAAGRRVGALALGAAVVVPTLVPGLSEGLFNGNGNGFGTGRGAGTLSVVNPILNLREDLTDRADLEVLTYMTDQVDPEPLRIVTVDSFDGETWGPSTSEVPRSQVAAQGLPQAPGLDSAVDARPRRTTISIETLRQGWLPAPYPATVIDVDDAWLYEQDTLNVVGDGVSTEGGLVYTVRHLEVDPSPQQLADAPAPPEEVVERWTALPEGLPEEVVQTANDVAGDGDPFSQATALQTFFRSGGGFEYTLDAPEENGSTAIAAFLERRNGYCVHFASAMAVMARSLGIPARVAVGFLPGTRQADDSYSISLRDAHAWPELYFEGVGWMRFEPTPSTRTGTLPGWAAPLPDASDPGASAPAPAPTAGQVPDSGASTTEGPLDTDEGFDLGATAAAVPWRVLSGLAAVLLVVSSPALASLLVRRRRWRQARDPGARAEAAWLSLTERLGDSGRAWPSSLTPRQAEAQAGDGLDEEARDALRRLARAVEGARYARTPTDEPELRRDVVRVVQGIERRSPTTHRWRATLLPRSGAEHLRSGLVEAGLALDRWERGGAGRVRAAVRKVSARRGDAASAAPGAP